MGYRLFYIELILAGLLFCSCDKQPDCLKGTGKIVSEERNIGYFNGIVLNDDINLNLFQDTINSFTVEAGENLMEDIISVIQDGMLSIENHSICKYTRSYKKEITVTMRLPDLEVFSYTGSARVISETKLKLDNFSLWTGGRGDVKLELEVGQLHVENYSGNGYTSLSGIADICSVHSKGMGLLDLRDLKVKKMTMDSKNVNDAFIWVTDTLEVTIRSMGNIYFRGNPVIKKYEKTGEGKLLILD